MKPVESLNVVELFDRLTAASYYGQAFRDVLRDSPAAAKAARTLVAEFRQVDFLRDRMEAE
jgi:hypothetical protein